MNHEAFVDRQIEQIDNMLSIVDDYELRRQIDHRSLLAMYRRTLVRLREAERFCVAAKALAYYKAPLESVITALDAWQRIATKDSP